MTFHGNTHSPERQKVVLMPREATKIRIPTTGDLKNIQIAQWQTIASIECPEILVILHQKEKDHKKYDE